MWEIWIVSIAVAILLYGLLRTRETFVVKVGNPFKGQELLSFDRYASGTRVFGTTPDTCPESHPSLEAGLCYRECYEGYHALATTCWADTKDIGSGFQPRHLSCEESGYPGYTNTGLFCQKGLSIDTGGSWKAWEWKAELDIRERKWECPPEASPFKGMVEGLQKALTDATSSEEIGNLGGVLEILKKSSYESYTDKVDGYCYRKCPADKPNHLPGSPWLCYNGRHGEGLSYDRGVGLVPDLFTFG